MPRETRTSLPNRTQVQTTGTTEQAQVVANTQVAAPRNSLQSVANALGKFMPGLEQLAEKEQREKTALEAGQDKLDDLSHTRDVYLRGEELYEEHRDNPEEAARVLNAYYEKALFEITDPERRNRIGPSILQYQTNAIAKVQADHFALEEQEDKEKLYGIISGVITEGDHSLKDISNWISLGTEVGIPPRELGDMLADVYSLKAEELGKPELIEQLKEVIIESQPVYTTHEEQLLRARLAASKKQQQNYMEANARDRAGVIEQWETGSMSRKTYWNLRDSRPDLFTPKEWEAGLVKLIKSKVSNVEGLNAAAYAGNHVLSAASSKSQQAFMKQYLADNREVLDEPNGLTKLVNRVAEFGGDAYVPWKAYLNSASVLPTEIVEGKIPEHTDRIIRLYDAMRGNKPMLDKHLTDPHAKKFFTAFNYARDYGQDMTDHQAYLQALQIMNNPTQRYTPPGIDKAVDKQIKSLNARGIFSEADNAGFYGGILRNLIQQHLELGAPSLEVAAENATEAFLLNFRKRRGKWLYTGAVDLPGDIDEVEEFIISSKLPDVDPDDYMIQPHPTLTGFWHITEAGGYLPLTGPFSYTKAKADLSTKNLKDNPPPSPQDIILKNEIERIKAAEEQARMSRLATKDKRKGRRQLTEGRSTDITEGAAKAAIEAGEAILDLKDKATGNFEDSYGIAKDGVIDVFKDIHEWFTKDEYYRQKAQENLNNR